MAYSWPDILPRYPILGAYDVTKQDNSIRFRPEVGIGKARRRFTASYDEIDVTFKMNKDQLSEFEIFYSQRLADGSLPFEMLHPVRHNPQLFQFQEAPTISQVAGTAYQVNLRLLCMGDP